MLVVFAVLACLVVGTWACGSWSDGEVGEPAVAVDGSSEVDERKISPEEAKEIMDGEGEFVLLDVRTEEEFAEARLAGAKLMPDYEVGERAEVELPDKGVLILVYCRSGGRSAKAAQELVDLGYTNVRDMGGILDWPFEVEDGGWYDGKKEE